jgi:hypothetical protein
MALMMRMTTGADISLYHEWELRRNKPKKRFPRPKNNIVARRGVVGGRSVDKVRFGSARSPDQQ